MDCRFRVGQYVRVMLMDSSIIEGDIVAVNNDSIIVDDVVAFGDMIRIEFEYIVDFRVG